MAAPIVSARGLSKLYTIPHRNRSRRGWRTWLGGPPTASRESNWVLDDVSFDVAEGEIVGVMGRNGSGKSTLLKLLARIVRPTRGHATVTGRVGTLLEVGTGFHPDLTGRENIYLNGTLLGMSPAEIRAHFDEIVDFAETERFLDLPVKFYSSGMYARLAFSVAAHLDPEILIVDEVLSVGDVEFQKKCLGKMGSMTRAGRTVFFVSHNIAAISSLCTRCLLLRSGRLIADATPEVAIRTYVESGDAPAAAEIVMVRPAGEPQAYITRAAVRTSDGTLAAKLEMGEPALLDIEYVIERPQRDIAIEAIVARNGIPLFTTFDTDTAEALRGRRLPGRNSAHLTLPLQHLKEGVCTVEMTIRAGDQIISSLPAALAFEIVNHRRDLTHLSYRADRPGHYALDIAWDTRRMP